MVIKAFNDGLYGCIGEQVYALEKLPEHHLSSRAFELVCPEGTSFDSYKQYDITPSYGTRRVELSLPCGV